MRGERRVGKIGADDDYNDVETRLSTGVRSSEEKSGAIVGSDGGEQRDSGCGGTDSGDAPLISIWRSVSGVLENFPSWALVIGFDLWLIAT